MYEIKTIEVSGWTFDWLNYVRVDEKYYKINSLGYVSKTPTTKRYLNYKFGMWKLDYDTVTGKYEILYNRELLDFEVIIRLFQGFSKDYFVYGGIAHNCKGERINNKIHRYYIMEDYVTYYYGPENFVFKNSGNLDDRKIRAMHRRTDKSIYDKELDVFLPIKLNRTLVKDGNLFAYYKNPFGTKTIIHFWSSVQVIGRNLIKKLCKKYSHHNLEIAKFGCNRRIVRVNSEQKINVKCIDGSVEITMEQFENCRLLKELSEDYSELDVMLTVKEMQDAMLFRGVFNWNIFKTLDYLDSNFIVEQVKLLHEKLFEIWRKHSCLRWYEKIWANFRDVNAEEEIEKETMEFFIGEK